MLKGFDRNLKLLEILSGEEVESIHSGTLDVLETTGVVFDHAETVDFLADHGCEADFEQRRVRMPGALVETCLSEAAKTFVLRARDAGRSLEIGGDSLHFSNSMGMSTVDVDTWRPRAPTREENIIAVKVLESLDTVHYIAPYTPYMEIEGVPGGMVMLEGMANKLRLSSKPISSAYQNDSEVYAIRMAEVVGTDLLGSVSVSSPLVYTESACVAMRRWIDAGFPICIGSGAIMGGSGPVTVAGSTIINNAELLAGVVLTQLIKPGTGVMVADFVHPMDMLRGVPAFGAVECALHGAVFTQIFRKYGIPTTQWYGFGSSKKADFQSGYERSMLGLLAAMSGTNVIEMHGALYGELTWHPAQAVMDEDVAGWIGRFVRGVEVSPETLAINLINEVGPIPGFYLDTQHTREWWRREQFMPRVADRKTYSEWLEDDTGEDALAKALKRVEELVENYEPKPLSTDQERELEGILDEARRRYVD